MSYNYSLNPSIIPEDLKISSKDIATLKPGENLLKDKISSN